MMVLNQPVYVSSVGGSSLPLGMAVNVQSEGMASNSQTGSSSREEASSPSSPASTDDLRNVLRQQLEYYFSKDNLATDKYLCEFCVWSRFSVIAGVVVLHSVATLKCLTPFFLQV